MTRPLEQRTIVIIGGTTGLGLSAAHACVAAGASVVVVGRSEDSAAAALGELGAAARARTGDAADPATAPRAIEEALAAFGRFDGLYHVAGGSGRRAGDGPLHELTDEGVAVTLEHNLVSLIYSNRAAVRQFMKQSKPGAPGAPGAILNMASVLGFSPAPHFFATHAYAAAKAGAIGFTQSCAACYAPHNIRFNVICPALVATPMSRRAQERPEILDYIRTKQPLDGGRIGQASDCDAAAVYFLSDQSRFVTGQVLSVDGGWTVSEGQYSS